MELNDVVAQPNRMVEFVREKVAETANEPQRLWKELRTLMLVDKASIQDEVLQEVAEFCLAVYDSCEPNASMDERQLKVARAECLSIPVSQKIGNIVQELTANDNKVLVKWGLVGVGTSVISVLVGQAITTTLLCFGTFTEELNQVDHREKVKAIWLYTLYSYVFARIYGRVPAGIFGIAAFAIGVTLGSGGCRSVCTKGCGAGMDVAVSET